MNEHLCLIMDDKIEIFAQMIENIIIASQKSENKMNIIFRDDYSSRITLQKYLQRIMAYMYLDEEDMICIISYIIKLSKKFIINKEDIYQLIGILSILYLKTYSDKYYLMSYYGYIIDNTKNEIYIMESCIVKLLDWRLIIDIEQYQSCKEKILEIKNENEDENVIKKLQSISLQ